MNDREGNGDGAHKQGAESAREEPAVRAPEGFVETLTANFRPQPAIPAMIVLLITIMFPVVGHDPSSAAVQGSWTQLLIPFGLLVSCGLAIAAGFCSFFPHLVWILVATWALKFTATGALPAYNRYVLFAGMASTVIMLIVQVWRVRTGAFTPTIRIAGEDVED